MRNELLEKVEGLKNRLYSILPDISHDVSEEEVLKNWISYNPSFKPVFAIAEDGSLNKRHYIGFYLFSIAGYAYGKKDGKDIEQTIGEVNISVIKNTERVDSYFRLLMFLCEIKSILTLARKEKPELIIIDGTLSSKFIVSAPKTNWFTKKEFSGELANLSGELIKDLKNILFDYDIASFSNQIEEKAIWMIKNRLNENPRRDILEALLSKLAYFEYFLLLYELFYELDWNPYIVGIGKTSHDTEIFEASLPDIKLFHKFIKNTGYSKPLNVSFESKAKAKTYEWEFSEVFQKIETKKANALKDITINYFYGKYDNIGNIISLIEVYENPEKEKVDPKEILDYLHYLSTGGYPYHLIKADKEVRITYKDMEFIESILGLQNELKGREELI